MSDFADALAGGVAAAALRVSPDAVPGSAAEFGTPELAAIVEELYAVRTTSGGLEPAVVDAALDRLTAKLSVRRPDLLTVVLRPEWLVTRVPELVGRRSSDLINGWFGACWLAEAAWRALHAPLTDPGFAVGDQDLLLPLAARVRFLVLTAPMRYRGISGNPWLPEDDVEAYPSNGLVGRVFGTESWNLLVGRCREARRVWRGYLDAYQSHPYLASANPKKLEAELEALVFAGTPRMFSRPRPHGPLVLSVRSLAEPTAPTAEDTTLTDEVTARHLLPRFRLTRVAQLAAYDNGKVHRGPVLLGFAVVLAAAATVICTVLLHVHLATMLAGTCYTLIGLGAVGFDRAWTTPWLLRLPAAGTVGLLVLLTLPKDWWQQPRTSYLAATALTMAAFGYLVVEARNHGVGGGWAVARSAAVLAVGATHALMVSLIGLVTVAPTFVESGSAMASLWHHPQGGPHWDHAISQGGMVLLLATAWCLAAGVFSQVLWEDRPITAPLAHLSWRSGR